MITHNQSYSPPGPSAFIADNAAEFFAAIKLTGTIPSMVYRWVRDAKTTTKTDEKNMRTFQRMMDVNEGGEEEEDDVEDDLGESPVDLAELPVSITGHGGKPVKRTRRVPFVRKMVWWAKSEFPGMVDSHTTADEEVLKLALTRHMRSLNVRNKDIVGLLPLIVLGVFMPTEVDVSVARMRATSAAATIMEAHKHWKPASPWWRFWGLGPKGWAPRPTK